MRRCTRPRTRRRASLPMKPRNRCRQGSPARLFRPLAAQARIQGNVILEVWIDETGKTRNIRLVRGHPMLATAAIEAVAKWTYQPLNVDGKPATVKTFVMVTFVGSPLSHDADDLAEMKFQNDFWTSQESAEDAIAKGDFSHAEEQLNQDKDLVSAGKGMQHLQERWQWDDFDGTASRGAEKV